MLRAAPRAAPRPPRSTAQKRRGVQVIQRAATPRLSPATQRSYARSRERSAKIKQRDFAREGKRARTFHGPPTPSIGQQSKMLQREIAASLKRTGGGHVQLDSGVSGRYDRVGSNEDLRKALKLAQIPRKHREQIQKSAQIKSWQKQGQEQVASAPALFAMKQLSRTGHAVAAAAREDVRDIKKGRLPIGHGSLTAAGRGFQLKDKSLFSDVLKEAGWKPKSGLGKAARSAVAFGLDVGLDPLTLASGGTTSLASKAALKEAKVAAKVETKAATKAARTSGVTRRQAKALGKAEGKQKQAAVYQKAREPGGTKGIDIRFGGQSIPGVTRGTVAAREGGRAVERAFNRQASKTKVGAKLVARDRAARLRVRKAASELQPGIRPPGMTPAQFERTRQIDRQRRATETQIKRRVANRAQAIHALVSPEEGALIRRAVERGDIESLKGIAKPIKLDYRHRKLKPVANDPDRLYKMIHAAGGDWDALRTRLIDAGTPVGWVGPKPPVRIPEVTANVPAAQKRAAQAGGQVRRAEREAQRHARPGGVPGRITPAERTRATRLAAQAKQRQVSAQREVERLKTVAAKVESPAAKAKVQAQLRGARGRAARARGEVEHWTAVTQRKVTPTRRVLGEEGHVIEAAAPPHGAARAARGRKRKAGLAVRSESRLARGQRADRRVAEKLADKRSLEPKGYYPRIPKAQIEEKGRSLELEDVLDVPRTGATGASAAKRRKVTESIEELERRAAQGDKAAQEYVQAQSHELGLVHQAYGEGMARAISRAESTKALSQEGRAVVPGQSVKLGEGEGLYRYEGGKLHDVDPTRGAGLDELRHIETGKAKPDEYVVLPKAMKQHFDEVTRQVTSTGQSWERGIGAWRKVALATSAYLGRNLASDLFAAYGAQNAKALAANYFHGQRSLQELGRAEKGYRNFQGEMETFGKGSQVTVNGKPMSYADLAFEAEAAGAIRQGRVAEIMEQRQLGKGSRLKRPKGTGGWQRSVQRVEDSARMATYIGFRKRGFSPERAAKAVGKIHFDYGELTRLEKGFRRAAPFYTFTARNLPRQAALLGGRPGKLAQYEKLREEAEKALHDDLDKKYKDGLDPYEQRQLGIPIKFGGKVYTASMSLPFTDLNDLVAANPKDPKSWAALPFLTATRRGLELVGPFKSVPELIYNYSLFYRGAIQDDNAPRTAVPGPVAQLADLSPSFRKQAGIRKIIDKRTGKDVWGWPKKLDYGVRQALPGPLGAAWRSTYGNQQTARGFDKDVEILGSLTGLRAKPLDPVANELNRLYTRQDTLTKAQSADSQSPARKKTVRYQQRREALSRIQKRIDVLQSGRLKFYKGKPVAQKQRALDPLDKALEGADDIGGDDGALDKALDDALR
jgi:hypothetical protein